MDDTQRVALQAFCDEVELLIMEAQEKLAELKTALAQEE